jgi:DNA-binding beta-propeller fold protein YncE
MQQLKAMICQPKSLTLQMLMRILMPLAALSISNASLAFEALITNERSGDIIHINDQGVTTHVVPACKRPRGMTPGVVTDTVLVACSDDDKVIVYNRSTRSIESQITEVPGAMNLAIDPATDRLFVTNEGASRASVYEISTGRLITQLQTGLEPDGIVITEDGRYIFVASENAGLIHVFNAESYQQEGLIRTNLRPRRIAIFNDALWVSSEMGSRVEIFSVETREKKDEVIFSPRGFRPEQMTPVDILFNSDANEAYVALGSANHVAVVDTMTREIIKYILVGRRAWGLGLSPDKQTLIVLNGLSDDFTLIDLATRRPRLTKRAGLIPHSVEVFE